MKWDGNTYTRTSGQRDMSVEILFLMNNADFKMKDNQLKFFTANVAQKENLKKM
jgi:hypothetical protein